MKVLVATPWLPPFGGGLERYALSIARELERAGHEVRTIGHGRELKPALRLSNTPLSHAIYARARELLRDERPDVVQVHTPVPGTAELVAHAARRERVPYVVTYHAGALSGPRGLLSAAARLHAATFERRMLVAARGRIAVSPFVARNALRGLPCDVIPPGVDEGRFRPVAEPVPGRVLFVGPASHAYAWKGLHVLAKAVERVPEAHLRVVGEGDLAAHYRARGIAVTGRVGDDELVMEYSKASVVVLPSVTAAESFGMVLAEANACERAVIGSEVGGIPSFVRHGENGLLVPPGDVDALAAALRGLLADEPLRRRMGRRGREIVRARHRWDGLAARTADVLAAAVAPLTAASARGPGRTFA